ncbi:MAG: manganese efflux pump MntP family protein [Oscillospiraceae bacterium]|nr:manganese efflux pump MntP family protein [Oscillospiraceae bacterium]
MNWLELFLLAVGLSMDAFAVAICLGLTMAKVSMKKAVIVGVYFGVFQAGMPVIGYIAAMQFADQITHFAHWVVFALLSFLGAKMIWDSFKKEKCNDKECSVKPCKGSKCPSRKHEATLNFSKMIPLALATSVDAMAVGVSFAFLDVNIVPAVSLIGIITLAISMAGVKIGNLFGIRFKSKAELAGGVILILMGVWVLIEHFLGL